MNKLAYVDALRGLAIIAVVMGHAAQYGTLELPDILTKIVDNGGRGVQLFFVASAFTLFLSFSNRITKENYPVKNFFIRRFFRIAPMYYLGICYYLLQDGLGARYWLGDQTHITVGNILSNIFFIHGINPYWITSLVPGGWSITVEMTFYLILPFLFLRVKNINQALIFFILSLIIRLLFNFVLAQPLISDTWLWKYFLFFYFPNQLPVFMLGIIMYFAIIEKQGLKNISVLSYAMIAGTIVLQLFLAKNTIYTYHIYFGILFMFLGIFLSKFKFKLIVNPIIEYIGRVSFSVYLVHFAVLHWMLHFNFTEFFSNGILNYITRFLIALVISVVIAAFFNKAIEKPFQSIGKRIIDKKEKSRVVS